MELANPSSGDLLLTLNGHGSIFIYRVLRNGAHDFYATSSSLLEVRGISRHSNHRKVKDDYQTAPDFTAGRVFDKGQARHLLDRYLPELMRDYNPSQHRILLRRSSGGWEVDVAKPAMKPGKARKPCRSRF